MVMCIGTYETEERAMEIIDEIFHTCGVEHIYDFTRDFSIQREILKETEKYPELCKAVGLYKMPEK